MLFQHSHKLHINLLVIPSLLTCAEFTQYLFVVFDMPDTSEIDFFLEIADGQKECKPGTTFCSQECIQVSQHLEWNSLCVSWLRNAKSLRCLIEETPLLGPNCPCEALLRQLLHEEMTDCTNNHGAHLDRLPGETSLCKQCRRQAA